MPARNVVFTREFGYRTYTIEIFEHGLSVAALNGRDIGCCLVTEDYEVDERGSFVAWDHRGVEPELPAQLALPETC